MIEAWASQKSFRPKQENKPKSDDDDPDNPTVNFHGEKRSNQTHESKSDRDARLARKGNGQEAKLCYSGNVMTENRNGLVVETELTIASGTAERDAAQQMIDRIGGDGPITVAGDKAYDTRQFVQSCRERNVAPHVAQNLNRQGGSAVDGRTTRHAGYAVSQRKRKLVEEFFGWLKTVAGQRKTKYRRLVASELDLHVRRGGLQPGQNAESGVGCRRLMGPASNQAVFSAYFSIYDRQDDESG